MIKLVIVIVLLSSSPVFALTAMGPTVSNLEKGKGGIEFDYFRSEFNVRIEGYDSTVEVETNNFIGNFGYGIFDGSALFLRFGFIDLEAEDLHPSEYVAGLGTKIKFAEFAGMEWGALFQVGWYSAYDNLDLDGYQVESEIEAYEYQVALGPTFKINGLRIYGGPLLHVIDCDFEIKVLNTTFTLDVEEESKFGGYFGLSSELTETINIRVEYQFTDDAHGFGLGLVCRF